MLSFKQYITESVVDQLKQKYREHLHKEYNNSAYNGTDMLMHAGGDYGMFDHVNSKYHDNSRPFPRLQNRIQTGQIQDIHPSDHIIDKLAEGDPSKDKKHLPMIAHWYNKGQFRAEDLGSAESHDKTPNWNTVHGTLKAFSDIKNKDLLPNIPHYDPKQAAAGKMLKGTKISSYGHMSWQQFRSHVHKHLGLDKAISGNMDDHPDVKLLGEHEGTKLYHLTSENAAKHANKCFGAKWCTGWEGKGNMFSHYNNDGPIYLAHHADGNVHQMHFETKQFMDKEDEAVDHTHLANKYPGLKKFPQIQEYHSGRGHLPFMPKERLHDYVNKNLHDIKNKEYDKHKLYKMGLIVARHGNHEQLKELDKHYISKSGSAGTLVAVRRITEFDESPVHPKYHGAEPGSEKHLAGLFDAHDRIKNLYNNTSAFDTHLHNKLGDKAMEINDEFVKHFGKKTRQNIEGARMSAVAHHHDQIKSVDRSNNIDHGDMAKAYMQYKELPSSDKTKKVYPSVTRGISNTHSV